MQVLDHAFSDLVREHRALLADYGQAQVRCSAQLRAQAHVVERLQAQVVRLRAEVIVRDSLLAWTRERPPEAPALLEDDGAPGRSLGREPQRTPQDREGRALHEGPRGFPGTQADGLSEPQAADAQAWEASLHAADLVICQTGCLGHDGFWRVHDHCTRTGKACVLVGQPEALRIMRLQAPREEGGDGVKAVSPPQSAPP